VRYKLIITVLAIALIVVSWLAFKPVIISQLVGKSMEPTIPDGAILIAVRADLYRLFDPDLLGDVVIFEVVRVTDSYAATHHVCHRVTYWNSTHFNSKGDANPAEDFPEPVPAEAIKHVVIAVIRQWR